MSERRDPGEVGGACDLEDGRASAGDERVEVEAAEGGVPVAHGDGSFPGTARAEIEILSTMLRVTFRARRS